METEVEFDFGSCKSVPGHPACVRYYQDLPPITGNKFSVTYPSTTVNRTFTSSTSAAGNLHLAIEQPGCKGSVDATWTTQKQ